MTFRIQAPKHGACLVAASLQTYISGHISVSGPVLAQQHVRLCTVYSVGQDYCRGVSQDRTGLVVGTNCKALGHMPWHQEAAKGMHLSVHSPLSSRHGVFDAHM
jgi:hypothetical protein